MDTYAKVEIIWVDDNDRQVGARLSFGEIGRIVDVPLQDLRQNYKGQLTNAIITSNGLRGKPGVTLSKQRLISATQRKIATYTLMHANDVVCYIYPAENRIELIAPQLLPFALTGSALTTNTFEKWLTNRIDNLSRTYMNKVYVIRKVGRDREKILRDSCAISIVDNFWVQRSDVDTTWQELKEKRDQSIELANTALTGHITQDEYTAAVEDTTSLFTLKGAFPKAVLRGFILKKDNNAEYEYAAYQLGNVLGIPVAEATKQSNGVVGCRIFTTEAHSMTHAADLLHLTDFATDNDEHRAVYEFFLTQGRTDIVKGLERLYILNYLAINTDFHQENFGFLYDSSTFRITSVAPAYDFNSAFGAWDDPTVFYGWIVAQLPRFMSNHSDITKQLQSSMFQNTLNNTELTIDQKRCIQIRANYLCRSIPT